MVEEFEEQFIQGLTEGDESLKEFIHVEDGLPGYRKIVINGKLLEKLLPEFISKSDTATTTTTKEELENTVSTPTPTEQQMPHKFDIQPLTVDQVPETTPIETTPPVAAAGKFGDHIRSLEVSPEQHTENMKNVMYMMNRTLSSKTHSQSQSK